MLKRLRAMRYLGSPCALGGLLWQCLGAWHQGLFSIVPRSTGECERHLAELKARQELGL